MEPSGEVRPKGHGSHCGAPDTALKLFLGHFEHSPLPEGFLEPAGQGKQPSLRPLSYLPPGHFFAPGRAHLALPISLTVPSGHGRHRSEFGGRNRPSWQGTHCSELSSGLRKSKRDANVMSLPSPNTLRPGAHMRQARSNWMPMRMTINNIVITVPTLERRGLQVVSEERHVRHRMPHTHHHA